MRRPVLGALVLDSSYQEPGGGRDLSTFESFYLALSLVVVSPVAPLPADTASRVVFVLIPIAGLLLLGQLVVRLTVTVLNRNRSETAVASTYSDHVIVAGLSAASGSGSSAGCSTSARRSSSSTCRRTLTSSTTRCVRGVCRWCAPTLGRNGTYVAVRKIHTKVAAWRQYLRANTSSAQEEALLAAKMVGRWPSGAPLTLAPEHDDAALGAEPHRNNDFLYWENDDRAVRCDR